MKNDSTAPGAPEFPSQPLMFTDLRSGARAPAAPLKLMCVVAHPDDECYAFGGALALASSAGAETYVICMTDGRAATNRGGSATAEELGQMRRKEFADSCAILGVRRHELLDYQDGQLELAAFSDAAAAVVERMRSFRPDVVLTFGGDGGMNTHADHTMVSAITTAAFHWAASPKRFPDLGSPHMGKRLFYVTTDFFLPDRQPPMPAPWTVTLDIRSVQNKKFAAFRAHTSQRPLMERSQSFFETHGAVEHYALAATRQPGAAVQSTGLSAGL